MSTDVSGSSINGPKRSATEKVPGVAPSMAFESARNKKRLAMGVMRTDGKSMRVVIG
jgi:hypothetical protein